APGSAGAAKRVASRSAKSLAPPTRGRWGRLLVAAEGRAVIFVAEIFSASFAKNSGLKIFSEAPRGVGRHGEGEFTITAGAGHGAGGGGRPLHLGNRPVGVDRDDAGVFHE